MKFPIAPVAVATTVLLCAACNDGPTSVRSSDPGGGDPALSAAPSPGTRVSVRSAAAANECLTVQGTPSAGAHIVISACSAQAAQTFTATAASELRTTDGRFCVDAFSGKGRDGDPVGVWSCTGGSNQKWTATASGELKGVNAKCVSIWGASTADGTAVAINGCQGAPGQHWVVAPVGGLSVASATAAPRDTARSADGFVNTIGTAVAFSYLSGVYGSGFYTIVKPRLQELGVRNVRASGGVVPDANWMRLVYGRMNEIGATGVKFDVLFSAPVIDGHGTRGSYLSADPMNTVLGYLNPQYVASFEGLNEHNTSGHADWATEVRGSQRALDAMAKTDPRWSAYSVLGPTVTNFGAASTIGDLSAYMDFGSMHSYPGGQMPSPSVALNATGLRPLNGARRLVATETGYHNAEASTNGQPGVSERASGRYIPRLFFEYFNAGVVRTYTYELIDQGTNPTDAEQHFGLLRNDGSAKPAFVALKNVIALLKDPGAAFTPGALTYQLGGDTTAVHHTLLQKRDGRFYLVLWQEVPSYDVRAHQDLSVASRRVTVTLGTTVQHVRTYTPLQSASPTTDAGSSKQIAVDVPDHPVVVEITP